MKKLLLLISLLVSLQSVAQDTEFWFAAPDIAEHTSCGPFDAPIIIAISNTTNTEGSVTITLYNGGNPVVINGTVPAGGLFRHDITNETKGQVENPRSSAGNVTKYGIHISATVPVTVYYQILPPCNQDVFSLKGSSALGTEFYVPMVYDSYYYTGSSYPLAYDQIDIVASEDGTSVTIVPTQTIRIGTAGSSSAGTPVTRILNKGETLKIMEHAVNGGSLGGTKITSTKPVAVTTTEDLIGRTGTGWDVIGDQIVPVKSLGSSYVVVKGFLAGSDRAYIFATEDGTTVSVNSGSITNSPVLNAGDGWFFDLGNSGNTGGPPQAVSVVANKAIYCYHISGVKSSGDELGSGLLPSVYSIGQTQLSYYQHVIGGDRHYGFVVFRTGTHDNFTITYNGSTSPVSVSPINIPGVSDWKAAKIDLPAAANNKVVTIKNSRSPFSFGYFSVNTTNGGASYGYLSAFGDFKFPSEKIYKCRQSSVNLDGGYAKNYVWTYPDGSVQSGAALSSISTAQPGRYILEMDQDPRLVRDTCYVYDLYYNASINQSPAGAVKVGTAVSLSANVNQISGQTLNYQWTFPGGSSPVSSTSSNPSVIFYESGTQSLSLKLTYTSTFGALCDTTLVYDINVQPNIVVENTGKDASVNGTSGNGTSVSPLDVYRTDNLIYTLTAKNMSPVNSTVSIYDTIPDGLEVKTINDGGVLVPGSPRILKWENLSVATNGGTKSVSFVVTPSSGAGTNHTNYVNRAQIRYDNGGTIVTTNPTYHLAKAFQVTFTSGAGGSIVNGTAQAVDYTDHPVSGVTVIPNTGYRFSGWSYPSYTDRTGGTQAGAAGVLDYTTIEVKGNIALTANFARNIYGITYALNGGVDGSPANPYTYHVDTTFTLSSPTKTGYKFSGWTGSNGSTPQTEVNVPIGTTDPLNYTANWTPVSYTISYNYAGGTGPTPPDPVTYDIESATITLGEPIRIGYNFTGWTGSNGTEPQKSVTIPTGTIGHKNYTANWTPTLYTIVYDFNNGVAPATPNPLTYDITKTPFDISNEPTRSGYKFAGWTGNNGSTSQPIVTVAAGTIGNLSYMANWTMDTYIINYDYKGGIAPAISNKASYNVTDLTFVISNKPTRAGYTFIGWTGSNGSTPQLTVTISNGSTGDKNFEANWQAIDYNITYNGNGGIIPAGPTSYRIVDPDITLSPSVHTGYIFKGWQITSDSAGVSVPTGITIPAGTYGNLTCDAQWEKNVYTITYDYKGGTAHTTPNPVYYDVTTPTITLHPPSRAGYTFTGWTITSDATGVTIPSGSTIPLGTNGNLVCVANWSTVSFTISYNYDGGTDPGNPSTYTIATPTFNLLNPLKTGKTFVGWTGSNGDVNQTIVTIPQGTTGNLSYIAHWNYNFSDRYGTSDTLYYCSPSMKLESGYDGLSYVWLLPDGSSMTTPSIMAPVSGQYYLQTNYGSMVLTDSIYVLYAFETDLKIKKISTAGPKVGKAQTFTMDLNPLLTNVTYQWTFQGDVPATSASDTVTVVFNSAGKKKITLELTVNNGGLICQKAYNMEIVIYDGSRGFFVDCNVSEGAADGSSWKNAYRTIQEALKQATEGDYIWVAKGEYKPDNKNSFLLIRDSIEIYGGFGAWESYLYEREFANNQTVLKGAGHSVIVNLNAGRASRWDGFIIEEGNALKGGGIQNNNSSVIIANSIIRDNVAEEGAGIYSLLGAPLLYNVEISGNRAEKGAGIYNYLSDADLINVTVSGNKADKQGGALYNESSTPRIYNTILWGNRSEDKTALYNEASAPFYSYSLIEGSKVSNQWDNKLGVDGGYNMDGSPLFMKNGFDNEDNMQRGNYRLKISSRVVDKGLNRYIYNVLTRWGIDLQSGENNTFITGVPFDLTGMERVQNDRVDIGAYEFGTEILDPNIQHRVYLPEVEGLETDPISGEHFVKGHQDFVFIVKPKSGYSLDYLVVTTGVPIRDQEGIRMIKNADGSVTVTIIQVWEPLTIGISGVSPVYNESIVNSKVWSYGGYLYVETVRRSVLQVYTLGGLLYKQMELSEGETKISLSSGFYIVVIDEKKYKIVIK